MIQWFRDTYNYLYSTFHGSETILWARLNMALGSAWFACQAADFGPIFNNPKYLTMWIIFSNFVNEMARRRNAQFDEAGKLK